MATLRFTDSDRDDQGFIKTAPLPSVEPRSLASLLPQAALAPDQTIRRRPPTKGEIAGMVVLGILLIVLLGYVSFSGAGRPAAPPHVPAATPATVQSSGDGILAPSPLPAATPVTAGRLLIAFAAPDGTPLGAIESTRAITPTAHYGDSWIQADVQGSGLVWLRAADSPELAITGPDLSPRRSAPPPAAAPAAAPQAPAAPRATDPPPPPCASAGIPGKMVEVCGYDDLSALQEQAKQQWLATYGGNAGIVTTPTPPDWSTP